MKKLFTLFCICMLILLPSVSFATDQSDTTKTGISEQNKPPVRTPGANTNSGTGENSNNVKVSNPDSQKMAPDRHSQKPAVDPEPMTELEFKLAMALLIFALIVIIILWQLIRSQNINAQDTVKFILITLIIISTLFLIAAGYSNDQMAPAIGLLGTIAGYLLGRNSNPLAPIPGTTPPPPPPTGTPPVTPIK